MVQWSQYWWETRITCVECKSNYKVQANRQWIKLFLNSDLEEKKEKGRRWYKKLEDIYDFADCHGYIDRIVKHLERLRPVSEVKGQIRQFTIHGSNYQTFRRYFNSGGDTKEWIKQNIVATVLPEIFSDMLGINDPVLNSLVAESDALLIDYQRQPKPFKILKNRIGLP